MTLTKSSVVAAIAEDTGLSASQVQAVLGGLDKVLVGAAASGQTVQLTGTFTMKVADRAERRARNPRTGEEILIPAGKAVRLSPGALLKDAVNS